MTFRTAQLSVGQSGQGEDRATVLLYADRVVIAVADGAGGSGRGAHAAEAVLKLMIERCDAGAGNLDVVDALRDCDLVLAREAAGGETTAVAAIIDERGVVGASVGDSAAWIVEPTSHTDLTQHQVRKPLVGSGQAVPVPFGSGPLKGTLLLGTDGLFKYGNAAQVRQIAMAPDIETIPERLIGSVRLRSGALQDDTTVVLCRRS
jgi:serine/threonine protein phosphatase PrpC